MNPRSNSWEKRGFNQTELPIIKCWLTAKTVNSKLVQGFPPFPIRDLRRCTPCYNEREQSLPLRT